MTVPMPAQVAEFVREAELTGRRLMLKDWDESLHPRDEQGQFTATGGLPPVKPTEEETTDTLARLAIRSYGAKALGITTRSITNPTSLKAVNVEVLGKMVNEEEGLIESSESGHHTADLVQRGWAQTSSDSDPTAIRMQTAADEVFGLDADMTFAQHVDAGWSEVTDEQARAMVQATYDRTQAMFKAAGITEVTVYRGLGWPSGQSSQPSWAEETPIGGLVPDIDQNPLSSWSLQQPIAARFAESQASDTWGEGEGGTAVTLAARVPVERIWSTPTTGPGCLHEDEVIVLGGRDMGMVTLQDVIIGVT